MRTQRAAVAIRQATNLATHLPVEISYDHENTVFWGLASRQSKTIKHSLISSVFTAKFWAFMTKNIEVSCYGHELGILVTQKAFGVHSSTLVTPTWSCHVWYVVHCLSSSSLARHWQAHLPDAIADDTSLYPKASPTQYWMELCRDLPSSIRLDSHLVRGPNS